MSPLPDARGAATQPFATRKVFSLVPRTSTKCYQATASNMLTVNSQIIQTVEITMEGWDVYQELGHECHVGEFSRQRMVQQ